MNKRTLSIFVLLGGISILCIALFTAYKDFFVPRIGPIGTGERAWTVYAMHASFIIIGLYNCILGTYLLIKNK